MTDNFYSLYTHGFIRAAVCLPRLRVADPMFNAAQTLELARQAAGNHAAIALFPELGFSAYSNEDLFHQEALLSTTRSALCQVIEESRFLSPVLLVGAPLRFEDKLFNCAIVIYHGSVLGIVPKTYLPNHHEFYEKRQFCAARHAISRDVVFADQRVLFGNDIVFSAENMPGFTFHVELCEDLWTPIPPSTYAALNGATILANLSASNSTTGKADYRRTMCAAQSGKCIAAYLYSAAGFGESTTDLAWDGHAMIYENARLLAESSRFSADPQIIFADIDLEQLQADRMRLTSFNDSAAVHKDRMQALRRVPYNFVVPEGNVLLDREVPRYPYVPSEVEKRDQRCFEVYNIQVQGLMKRLSATGLQHVVIGVSGGLDSTQALIVAAKTMDQMEIPREHILAYTMPGFATSNHTLENARALMQALGVTANELDIRPSCSRMLSDIGHPYADGEPVYDVTFENVQAGERTSHLFRLANFHNGLVLGTGDLSELALGWATYGVGDQMSHYNVNASVPKTLIQHLIRWSIQTRQFKPETCRILQSILDTEISPELVPGDANPGTQNLQSTEQTIGPFELQDFNLYHVTRYGFLPSKIAYLAYCAWHDKHKGAWPDLLSPDEHHEYNLSEIKKWLRVFLFRFFKISQFKRSAMPNGPKVGSGGSLSPRGDWRAPSDAEPDVWLIELETNVPD